MQNKATVIACVNQKGGTGKTCTAENLGIGMVQEGKKVLLVDMDPQASLTISLGYPRPDDLPVTVSDQMAKVMQDMPVPLKEGILTHEEGVELMPASIALSGLEVSLVNAMSRESVLKQYLEPLKKEYDFIILDCMPIPGRKIRLPLQHRRQRLLPMLWRSSISAMRLSGTETSPSTATFHSPRRISWASWVCSWEVPAPWQIILWVPLPVWMALT